MFTILLQTLVLYIFENQAQYTPIQNIDADRTLEAVQTGCHDPKNCEDTRCMEGCIDCINANECSSCEYGYFLYHTPKNTIECIKCPYIEEVNQVEKFKCADCVEMPLTWEYNRKCTFKYTFGEDSFDLALTPYNTTVTNAEIFAVKYNSDVEPPRFEVDTVTDFCTWYKWENFQIDTLLEPADITSRLTSLNKYECTRCDDGYILNADKQCDTCESRIPNCISCYNDPSEEKDKCFSCEYGLAPAEDESKNSVCKECSELIPNCYECFKNSNLDIIQCSACDYQDDIELVPTYNSAEHKFECSTRDCEDSNCLSCPEDYQYCEECDSFYELQDGECQRTKECSKVPSGAPCEQCYTDHDPDNNCLLCGKRLDADPIECLQYCQTGNCYDAINKVCQPCDDLGFPPSCEIGIKTDLGGGETKQDCQSCAEGFERVPNFKFSEASSIPNKCIPCFNSDTTSEDGALLGSYGDENCTKCTIEFSLVPGDSSVTGANCTKCEDGMYVIGTGETQRCEACPTELNCGNCIADPDNPGEVLCQTCSNPLHKVQLAPFVPPAPAPLGGQCVSQCNDPMKYNNLCSIPADPEKDPCIKNEGYNNYSTNEITFVNAEILCKRCNQGYSLDSVGKECKENKPFCRASIAYNKEVLLTINEYNQDEENNHFCYNECLPSQNAGFTNFFDPVILRCVECPTSEPKCRKKFTVTRYLYPGIGGDKTMTIDGQTVTMKDMTNFSDAFKFNIDPSVNDLDTNGVSMFELNVIVVFDSKTKKYTFNDEQKIAVESNIPDKVFRISDLSVKFRTELQSNLENPDTAVEVRKPFIFEASEKIEFEAEKIIKFSMKDIVFSGPKQSHQDKKAASKQPTGGQQQQKQQDKVVEIKIKMKNCLPQSILELKSVQFQNENNYHLVPKFQLQKIGTIKIEDFEYESKVTNEGSKITGFQMFELLDQDPDQKFTLEVVGFTLSQMFIYNSVIFDLPARNARVSLQDIYLSKCNFKKSYLLRDSSSGFSKGQQWIEILTLNVERTQFYDSSLIEVYNSNYFRGEQWSFDNIHMSTYSLETHALITTNTFLFKNIRMEGITLYQTTIMRNTEAMSTVPYIQKLNYLENVQINDLKMFTNEDMTIFKMDSSRSTELINVVISTVQALTGVVNQDVNVLQSDAQSEVYALISYQVKGLSGTSIPQYLLSVETDAAVEKVQLTVIQLETSIIVPEMNILKIQNVPGVEMDQVKCGQFKMQDPFIGKCIDAYSTAKQYMGKFQLTNSVFNHIYNDLENPVMLKGYDHYELDGVEFNRIQAIYGVYISILTELETQGTINIRNSKFINIKTIMTPDVEVPGGGLVLDGSFSPKIQNIEVSGCEFDHIQSRYQAAGIYLKFPSSKLLFTLKDSTFKNIISVKGAVLHASLQSTLSEVDFENVTIEGPGDQKKFIIKNEFDDYEGNKVILRDEHLGISQFLKFIKMTEEEQKAASGQEIVVEEGEEEEEEEHQDQFINTALQYPSTIFIHQSSITMVNVIVKGIRQQQGMRITDSKLTADRLHFEDQKCIACSKTIGVNSIEGTPFTIRDSTFKNSTSYKGGILYIGAYKDASANPVFYTSNFTGCTFEKNIAQVIGGGLYIKDHLFNIDSCKFIGNIAIGDYRKKNDPKKGEAGGIFTEVASGTNSKTSNVNQSAARRILNTNTLNVVQNTEFKDNKAQVGASARITGGVNTTLHANTFSGNIADAVYGDQNQILSGCTYGEGMTSDEKCQECPPGQYSLDPMGMTCKACISDRMECQGGDRIIIKAGFWRPHNLSDQVEECKNNKANCLESELYSNFNCREGYTGALCEACDLLGETTANGTQYSVSSSYNCGTCDNQTTNGIKVGLMNVWVLITMFLAVKGTLDLIQNKIMLRSILILFKGFRAKYDETGILIKMFTNYAQIIAILSTLDIELPNALTDAQDVLGNPVKSMGNALDCYLVELQDKIPNIYFKILWQIVMNFLQFLVFLLVFGLLRCLKKTRVTFNQLWWTTVIYLLIYLQPSYVNAVLAAISCREISGYKYILADVAYICGSDSQQYIDYTVYLLVPFLVLWILVLPAVMFFILYKHKNANTLQRSETLYRYGFLYQEYTEKAYYWEIVKVFQKTLIVAVIQLYSNDIKEKAILVFEIVFVYAILSYFKSPYERKNLNELDILSSIVCMLSLITGVFIWNIRYTYWEWFGLISIFLINTWFVFLMIYKIAAKFRADLNKEHADKIEKAKKKLPCLKKIFKQSPESLERNRQRWKKIRAQVQLLIDGIQAGAVIPITEKKSQQTGDIAGFSENQPLISSNLWVKQNEEQNMQIKEVEYKRKSKRGNHKNVKHKKTYMIPELNRTMTKQFKDDKKPLFTSQQVLNNELTQEQKEQLMVRVHEYRKVQKHEAEQNKEELRKYFIEVLGFKPSEKYEESSKELKQKRLSKNQVAPINSVGELEEEHLKNEDVASQTSKKRRTRQTSKQFDLQRETLENQDSPQPFIKEKLSDRDIEKIELSSDHQNSQQLLNEGNGGGTGTHRRNKSSVSKA